MTRKKGKKRQNKKRQNKQIQKIHKTKKHMISLQPQQQSKIKIKFPNTQKKQSKL